MKNNMKKSIDKWLKENSVEIMEASNWFNTLIDLNLVTPDIPGAICIQAARIWVKIKTEIALQDFKESGILPPDIVIGPRAIKEMKEIALKLSDLVKTTFRAETGA